MENRARDRKFLSVVTYNIRDWPDNPKRTAKESKLGERAMSDTQRRLWNMLCDPATTDEPLRLAMLDAALRVKHEHMRDVIKSLGVSAETEAAIEQSMQSYRESILNPA